MINGSKWHKLLTLISAHYNSCPTAAHNTAPFRIIFARDMNFGIRSMDQWTTNQRQVFATKGVQQYLTELERRMKHIRKRVIIDTRKITEKRTAKQNRKRKDNPFSIGDYTYRLLGDPKQRKLLPKYDGPWRIIAIESPVTVVIQDASGTIIRDSHVGRLKLNREVTEEPLVPNDVQRNMRYPVLRDPDIRAPVLPFPKRKRKKVSRPQIVIETDDDDDDEDQSMIDLRAVQVAPNPTRSKCHGILYRYLRTLKIAFPYKRRKGSKFIEDKTNPTLAKVFATKIISEINSNAQVLELMAGSGAISQHLPKNSTAIEQDPVRAKEAQLKAPHVHWIIDDLLSDKTLNLLLSKRYDYVIANPDFGMAIVALAISEEILTKKGEVWMLLPSDYWNTSPLRANWLKSQCMHIKHEFKLGRQTYRDTLMQKRTPDSLFIFEVKKGPVGETYSYPTTHISLPTE